MISRRSLAIALALVASPILAQPPRFDVASIKPADPSAPQRGRLSLVPIVTNPGRLTARNANLKELIQTAYSVEGYQVSGGPAWLVPARFDVEAKSSDTGNRSQLLLMLRALLNDRFKLAVHRETRDLAIYALTVAKNGPKFHALTTSETACWPGCADSPAKINRMRQRDLPSLATFLTRLGADKPVIDQTGLKGEFALELDMEKIMTTGAAAPTDGPPTNEGIFEAIANAMPNELGLKLVAAKAPIEILVIDHAEKPSGN
jgi:uncharacterized protein (TIGR03435 family)